jgi:hypothetical protein
MGTDTIHLRDRQHLAAELRGRVGLDWLSVLQYPDIRKLSRVFDLRRGVVRGLRQR